MGDSIGREAILLGTIAQVMPDPIFVLDKDGVYLEVIGGMERSLYGSSGYLKQKRLHDVFRRPIADRLLATVREAIDTRSLQIIEYEVQQRDMKYVLEDGPTGSQWFEGRVIPFTVPAEKNECALWIAINITEKKAAQNERDKALEELGRAAKEIKSLRGILPLCCHCKKVRDDKWYWKQVDEYIRLHTDADISHSICPECLKEHFPELIEDT